MFRRESAVKRSCQSPSQVFIVVFRALAHVVTCVYAVLADLSPVKSNGTEASPVTLPRWDSTQTASQKLEGAACDATGYL